MSQALAPQQSEERQDGIPVSCSNQICWVEFIMMLTLVYRNMMRISNSRLLPQQDLGRKRMRVWRHRLLPLHRQDLGRRVCR